MGNSEQSKIDYYSKLEEEHKKEAHVLAREKIELHFKELSKKGDVLTVDKIKKIEKDLGYQEYSLEQEYTGYKFNRTKYSYVSGYSGSVDSNGHVNVTPDHSSYYEIEVEEKTKTCVEKAYYKVVKKGEGQEVRKLEEEFRNNSDSYYDYQNRSLNKPSNKVSRFVSINFTLSAVLCLVYLIMSIGVIPNAAVSHSIDLMLFNLVPNFKENMLSISNIVNVFLWVSFGLACFTFLVELCYYSKFKKPQAYALYIVYLSFILLSFAFSYWCGNDNNLIWFSIVMLNIFRIGLYITITIIIILIAKGYGNKHYKAACYAVDERNKFVSSGQLAYTEEVLNEIRSYTVEI